MKAWCVGLLLAIAGGAMAQGIGPLEEPRPAGALRDAEFGVATRQFGLQRKVEMYQWRKRGDAYERVWSERPIDSRAHDEAHANPDAMPMQTRYWVASQVQIEGKPVDEGVLKALGEWRDFRPGFSALPGNLSATFQPEGNGLGSAENPLVPELGDLRVTWRELTLPPLAGRVVLVDGRWIMAQPSLASASTIAAGAQPQPASKRRSSSMLPIGIGALVVLVAVVAARRRRSGEGRR